MIHVLFAPIISNRRKTKEKPVSSNSTGFPLYIIHISIATSANNPGIPKKPDTVEVTKLIGT